MWSAISKTNEKIYLTWCIASLASIQTIMAWQWQATINQPVG